MYNRKPQKSFFEDSGAGGSGSKRFAANRNDHSRAQKENRPPWPHHANTYRQPLPTREIHNSTKAKLSAFALGNGKPAAAGPSTGSGAVRSAMHGDNAMQSVVTPSRALGLAGIVGLDTDSRGDDGGGEPMSSQERVQWKISPPTRGTGLSQGKLTIDEVFDIYQASQRPTVTPTRRPGGAAAVGGERRVTSLPADPLPHLNLELSPGLHKPAAGGGAPPGDKSLRRSTSMPMPLDGKSRKRRKVAHADVGKVQKMLAQMHSVLNRGCQASELGQAHTADRDIPRDDGGKGKGTAEHTPAPVPQVAERQQTRPAPSRSEAVAAANTTAVVHAVPIVAMAKPQIEAPSDDFGSDGIDAAMLLDLPALRSPVRPGKIELIDGAGKAHAMLQPPKSPGTSSNYEFALDDDDLLAATQEFEAHGSKPATTNGKLQTDTTATTNTAGAKDDLSPKDLLDLMGDDDFSDFDEPAVGHLDAAMYEVVGLDEGFYIDRSVKQCQLRLSVTRPGDGAVKEALLRGDWANLKIDIGDTIRMHGSWETTDRFVATNTHGLVILHPDVLISATSVADTHTCMRKAALQDRVRATSQLSKPLLYGSMLHEILQHSLFEDDFSDATVRAQIEKQIKGSLEELFLLDESIEAARDYLHDKVLLIQRWAHQYVGAGKLAAPEPIKGQRNTKRVALGIRKILEVEERFWSPSYGLKGNVDVTATIALSENDPGAATAGPMVVTGPLEFKTGNAERSVASHRAQTILYTLMLSERYGVEITAGYLYYLETCQTTRVVQQHHEIRGLLQMRNELAAYLKTKTIPGMLKNTFQCKSCYAGDACFVYHRAFDDGDGDTSGLKEIFLDRTSHLSAKHIAFFNKWEHLLTQEEGEMFKFRNELWHMTTKEREAVGRCYGHVTVVPSSEQHVPERGRVTQWTYLLQRAHHEVDFLESQIAVQDPVVISDERGVYAIACGYITRITAKQVEVHVDRPLRDSRAPADGFDPHTNQVFRGTTHAAAAPNNIVYRLDRDEFKNGMGMVRNNLIQLMLDSNNRENFPNAGRQRELLIDLAPPRFELGGQTQFPGFSQANLNVDQVKAKDKVLATRDYSLILGMPGTGKTTTIAAIIRALVAAAKSILLTSYTHSAVDTILLKLLAADTSTGSTASGEKAPKILRLGSEHKIHPGVREHCALERHQCTTFDALRRHYDEPSVVATTCLSINHACLRRRRFDYCIVDEASQITLPVCIGPLRFADRFVLVGDHFQLPPLVKDVDARAGGLDVSLFMLLSEKHPQAVVTLEHQYRMNADIMSLSNALIYGHRLKCGTAQIARQRLEGLSMKRLDQMHKFDETNAPLVRCNGGKASCWVEQVLDPARPVVYLNTDGLAGAGEKVKGDQRTNPAEAALCRALVDALRLAGIRAEDIGVISPYRSQLKALQRAFDNEHTAVSIDTADKYQGRDRDVILISFVRSNSHGSVGDLLADWRRVNVALTRARKKLIIVGSQQTLATDALLNGMLHLVHNKGWSYDLADGAHQMHVPIKFDSLHRPLEPQQLQVQQQQQQAQGRSSTTVNEGSAAGPRLQVKRFQAGRRALLSNGQTRGVLRDVVNSMS